MALKVERRGVMTSESLGSKPQMCFSCKQRKEGLFTVDPYNKPRCGDCTEAQTGKRP